MFPCNGALDDYADNRGNTPRPRVSISGRMWMDKNWWRRPNHRAGNKSPYAVEVRKIDEADAITKNAETV